MDLTKNSGQEGKEELSLGKRLSRFGHRLCLEHDFFSLKKVRGKTNTIRRFYDFLAPVYDLIYPRSTSYLDSARHLAQNFVQPGDRVLDLGAGTGLLTKEMLPKALSIISFDLHEKMLRQGQKKVLKEIRDAKLPSAGTGFCQGNALCLPFADNTFDLVATAFMLVYLTKEQKVNAIKEAKRVVRDDGRIVLLTFQGEIHPRFTPRAGWREVFEEAGLDEPIFDDFSEVFRTISITA